MQDANPPSNHAGRLTGRASYAHRPFYGQVDYLRTLGIRLLGIPNAMLLDHPDEFVPEVMDAIRASVEKAGK